MKSFLSERADSEVIGHVIILSITILGISMLTIFGVPAIYSLQDMANAKNAEQAFTVLDSRASRVTLGDSPLQITNINLGGGTLTVEPNSTGNPSYIVINSSSFNIILPMGKIKYALGDRIVAYEGGGVWAQYPGGGSIMLSPPEIHYNGVTLTLPVINISGNASVGGKGTATVSLKKIPPIIQFPHPDMVNRTNPVNVTAGKVYVNITSNYYLAWADYAESLGYTEVTTNSTRHNANIELTIVPSTLGESTYISNTIIFRGLNTSDDTPLENFSFKLYSSNFNNFDWDIRAKSASGNKTLIFYFKKDDEFKIGYKEGSLPGETWDGDGLFVATGNYRDVDLLNKSINLTYNDENDVGATSSCTPISGKISGIAYQDYSWDNLYITESDTTNKTQSIYNITQHYIQKMAQDGDFSFNQCATGGGGPGGSSSILIDYNAIGALTYLHITENRADVGIS